MSFLSTPEMICSPKEFSIEHVNTRDHTARFELGNNRSVCIETRTEGGKIPIDIK
ncbi:hypothetical protein NQZ68_028729 [Dissostichus eleginoides]|nr:hypothetical protein NQZ68_028729 [Dissostichus eleginoides]